MKVLTHEIKLEIKQKFREEMEGKIDTSWRNQYADYFVPRSAALRKYHHCLAISITPSSGNS
jgi:hypothetical protein